MYSINRREFITTVLAGLALGNTLSSCKERNFAEIPMRPFGNTGEFVTMIGLGGWDIVANKSKYKAKRLMDEALDEGLTFWDNCWEYHQGLSEKLMGSLLKNKSKRDKVFLMTKVCGRTYQDAKNQLEESLRRLNTDMIDLWQFHGLKWEDDPALIFANNGALKAALQAKEQGKIRHIGFTGHQNPVIHNEMLKMDFEWDSVQMPLNVLDAHFRSFQYNVLPECNKRNIAVLGMKSLAAQNGRIVSELGISANLARRYSLSLPISSLICGIQTREELRHDLKLARNWKPLNNKEINQLLKVSELPAQDGKIEVYKVGNYGCDFHHDKV